MKLLRFETPEGPRWGRLEGQEVIPTAGLGGPDSGEALPRSEVRLLPPAQDGKIVCVGRNYVDHISEMGHAAAGLPREPGLFLKGSNALAPSGGHLTYPSWTQELHFEGELALIIGQRAAQLTPVEVPAAILGYTCALDLTPETRNAATCSGCGPSPPTCFVR